MNTCGRLLRDGDLFSAEWAGVLSAAAERRGAQTGAMVTLRQDATAAANGTDVLVTDSWAATGQATDGRDRVGPSRLLQVNAEPLSGADTETVVLQCLSAHRGLQITGGVIDGPRRAVWEEGETRLHAQRALLSGLVERR